MSVDAEGCGSGAGSYSSRFCRNFWKRGSMAAMPMASLHMSPRSVRVKPGGRRSARIGRKPGNQYAGADYKPTINNFIIDSVIENVFLF